VCVCVCVCVLACVRACACVCACVCVCVSHLTPQPLLFVARVCFGQPTALFLCVFRSICFIVLCMCVCLCAI